MARRVSEPEAGRRGARLVAWVCGIGWGLMLAGCSQILGQQLSQYEAEVPKTVLDLQPFRTESRVVIRRADGAEGIATLTNLNPYAGAWYLLTLSWPGNASTQNYHLETPRRQALSLRDGDSKVVRIVDANGFSCELWGQGAHTALAEAGASGLPYAPLCGGSLYLRNPVEGHHTSLERVTDFLRDHVWGGERVITFVKEDLYRDAFLERETTASAPPEVAPTPPSPLAPLAAAVAPESAEAGIIPAGLAVSGMRCGTSLARW